MSDPTYSTYQNESSGANEVNALRFMMRRYLASMRTATLCKVLAVTNAGGVTPVGTLDLQPLVQQMDGDGNVVDLPILYGVPYSRLQGGTDAVILDPKVGDLGVVVFGDRDLSAAIASKDKAPPGSNRRNSLSDAMWIGGYLNGAPTQYVRFSTTGIEMISPTKVTIKAPLITLDGPVTATSTVTAATQVTAAGIGLTTHKHVGVTTGGGTSGVPVP